MYIFPLHSSTSSLRDPSDPIHTQHPSAERTNRASKWMVTQFVAQQIAEYKEISIWSFLIHANGDVLRFKHFFGSGFDLISWFQLLTTSLVQTPYVILKG